MGTAGVVRIVGTHVGTPALMFTVGVVDVVEGDEGDLFDRPIIINTFEIYETWDMRYKTLLASPHQVQTQAANQPEI